MAYIHPAFEAFQCQRFMRPDAARWLREDARRYLAPTPRKGVVEQKYDPNQPRDELGRWTDGGAGGFQRVNDPRILSDAAPDEVQAGERYAQNRRGGNSTFVRINGQTVELSPGQAARLEVVQARAGDSIARVRELDPVWKPTPSEYQTTEGMIRAYEADAEQAQARASELARRGIGPGPFAGESIPARGPERDFTAAERRQINEAGASSGCHTCGATDPGTTLENWVLDHQPPSALNIMRKAQRLYPQCLTCSLRQGGWIGGRRFGK